MTPYLPRPPRIKKNGEVDKRGTIPKSLANLAPPYLPGTNGHGRVYPLKERLQHALDHPLKVPKADAPAGEQLVYATLKGAIELVPTPFRETWDRVEGKIREPEPERPQLPPINFVFILPDGTQVSPVALREVRRLENGNHIP